jgi:DNA replication protein DnaC
VTATAKKMPDGRWRIEPAARCSECHRELVLITDDEPSHTALRMAALVTLCEECEDRREAALEKARAERELADRLAESGLPEPLRALRFEDMIGKGGRTAAIEAARAWAEAPDAGPFYLYGDVGAGKTRLAATAVYRRLECGRKVRFVSVAVLMAQIGAAFNDNARREAIKVITGSDALVLDDLDKVSPSAWARQQLYAAINARVQAGAPLLVTANVAPRALRDMYGEAIASRLAGGGVASYSLPGPDYRRTLDEEADDARL